LDKIDWHRLNLNKKNIPIQILEKYSDKLDWKYLSQNININEQQKKYHESLKLTILITNLLSV